MQDEPMHEDDRRRAGHDADRGASGGATRSMGGGTGAAPARISGGATVAGALRSDPALTPEASSEPVPRTGEHAVIPPEQKPLDPRAIARASLQAGRNSSLWWVLAGVVVTVLVALAFGTPTATLVLAAVLAVGAVLRAIPRGPGPVVFVVRSRPVDVAVLFMLAFVLAVLSRLIPTA